MLPFSSKWLRVFDFSNSVTCYFNFVLLLSLYAIDGGRIDARNVGRRRRRRKGDTEIEKRKASDPIASKSEKKKNINKK